MVDMPPILPAVVELVGKQTARHEIKYWYNWKDYQVYNLSYPDFEKEGTEFGLPILILYKNGKARSATVDEQDAILFNIER